MADSDLRQWRLKVEIEEMSIDCSNGYLQIVEDGEERQNIKLCKQRWYKNVVRNQTLHFSFEGQSLNTLFTLMNTF